VLRSFAPARGERGEAKEEEGAHRDDDARVARSAERGRFSPLRDRRYLEAMGVSLITDGSELRSLRYPPGESPFHVKGIAYRGHLEYVEAHVPGGVDAMKAAFPDPAVAAFFDQV